MLGGSLRPSCVPRSGDKATAATATLVSLKDTVARKRQRDHDDDDANPPAARPSESSQLRILLSLKHCSIPFAVPTWLYFKRHVLEKEHVRSVFQQEANLSLTAFKELLIAHASPQAYAPSRARGSPRSQQGTRERYFWDLLRTLYDEYYPALLNPATSLFSVQPSARYNGLGLFARRLIVLEAGSAVPSVTGTVHAVSASEWVKLCETRYPSLYSDSTVDGILTGPLALVNHDCGSVITLRRRRQTSAATSGEVIMEIVAREPRVLRPGSELTIHYGGDGNQQRGFSCNCDTCCSQHL